MRYIEEGKYRESFEKYPPAWGDDEYGEDEIDEEQDNKRMKGLNGLWSST
jgi:hypothetical protein